VNEPFSSTTASTVLGLTFAVGLVISSPSASSASITIQQPTAYPSAALASNASSATIAPRVEMRPHIAAQLIKEAPRLSQANRAKAMHVADAVPFLATFIGTAEDAATEIECTWCDDESLLVEWMLRDRRIGFSFEKDESRSSWFIASNPPSPVDGSGYLSVTSPITVLVRGLLSR
jgi:hypothetical protein